MSDLSVFHPVWCFGDIYDEGIAGAARAFLGAGHRTSDGLEIVALRQDFHLPHDSRSEYVVRDATVMVYAQIDTGEDVPELAFRSEFSRFNATSRPASARAFADLLFDFNRDEIATQTIISLPFPWDNPHFKEKMEGRLFSAYLFRDFSVFCQEYPLTYDIDRKLLARTYPTKAWRATRMTVFLPGNGASAHERIGAAARLAGLHPTLQALNIHLMEGEDEAWPLGPMDLVEDFFDPHTTDIPLL